jgi:hypothetical protein
MNGETNLDHLARTLTEIMVSGESFRLWLDSGVRAIALDGQSEVSAFDPGRCVIGCQGPDWRHDLGALLGKLGQRHQLMMRDGLRRCLDFLKPEAAANDPSRANGRNGERLALTYLSLAREWKAAEVLVALDGLIHTKFPASQVVYASALLTWRMLADQDSAIDWRVVFLPGDDAARETRFKPSYSETLVSGMCLAQPRNAAGYLSWRPFVDYMDGLVRDLVGDNVHQFTRIARFCQEVALRVLPHVDGATLTPFEAVDHLVTGEASGIRSALARARAGAAQIRRALPSSAAGFAGRVSRPPPEAGSGHVH